MKLELSKNSSTKTLIQLPDGRTLYHVHTPGLISKKTTTIYKIPEANAQRYQGSGVKPLPEEELAKIHWHWAHDSRLIFNGKSWKASELLHREGIFTEDRTFTGPDGKRYKWNIGSLSSKLELDTGHGPKTVVAKFKNKNILIGRKPTLEVDDSVLSMLDLIVITFIYMETRRRDRETASNAAAAS